MHQMLSITEVPFFWLRCNLSLIESRDYLSSRSFLMESTGCMATEYLDSSKQHFCGENIMNLASHFVICFLSVFVVVDDFWSRFKFHVVVLSNQNVSILNVNFDVLCSVQWLEFLIRYVPDCHATSFFRYSRSDLILQNTIKFVKRMVVHSHSIFSFTFYRIRSCAPSNTCATDFNESRLMRVLKFMWRQNYFYLFLN